MLGCVGECVRGRECLYVSERELKVCGSEVPAAGRDMSASHDAAL